MHGLLVGDDLIGGTAQMDRAGVVGGRRGPRNAFLDREIHLERRRAVTEPAVRTGDAVGKPVAEDLGGDRRRHVEHQHVGWWKLVDRSHEHAGFDLAAVSFDVSGQRVGDRS